MSGMEAVDRRPAGASAESTEVVNTGRPRINSIDMLRGIVIVLMILDHVRDYFGPFPYAATDLSQTSSALFFTRWVTHLCAPIFVLLAGLGTALYESKGHDKATVARFLWTRGAWLIALELVVVNLSWHSFWHGFMFIQVIWVLGVSMILMAGIIRMPRIAIAVFGVALVVGHNLLDGVPRPDGQPLRFLWEVLHAGGYTQLRDGFGISTVYPLLPWPGLMALGYLMGPLYRLDEAERLRKLLWLGAGTTLAFVIIRALNIYGDPQPWVMQERGALYTVLSFLNTTKYPASLSFILMTIGPGLIALALLERVRGSLARALITFGSVPLFLYLIHIPLAHLVSVVYSRIAYGQVLHMYAGRNAWPEAYEPSLLKVHIVWLLITLALLPVCGWFKRVKQRRREWWIRYL